MENQEPKSMSVSDITILLSQTIDDVRKRKTTLKKAVTVSRLAMALAKVIETTELEERIATIEERLDSRDEMKRGR